MFRILTIVTATASILLLSISCQKHKDDIRSNYVGQWNFVQTIHSYSGYYDYTPDATWVSNSSTQFNYDDNTGSIALGSKKDELIIKYCATCAERVVNIDELGSGAEKLTYTAYEYVIEPGPAGYSPSYTTNTITGNKL